MDQLNAAMFGDSGAIVAAPNGNLLFEGATLTPTGLSGLDTLSDDQIVKLTDILFSFDTSLAWWIGDLLNHAERTWGETYARIAERYSRDADTLRNYVYVARNLSLRSDKLSWSHHFVVAAMTADEQARWLGLAAQGESYTDAEGQNRTRVWSVTRLRREIAADNPKRLMASPVMPETGRDAYPVLARLTPADVSTMKRAKVQGMIEQAEAAKSAADVVLVALRGRLADLDKGN